MLKLINNDKILHILIDSFFQSLFLLDSFGFKCYCTEHIEHFQHCSIYEYVVIFIVVCIVYNCEVCIFSNMTNVVLCIQQGSTQRTPLCVCVCVWVYIYIYIYMCVCVSLAQKRVWKRDDEVWNLHNFWYIWHGCQQMCR